MSQNHDDSSKFMVASEGNTHIDGETIVNAINRKIERLRNKNLEPAFIVLGYELYELFCAYLSSEPMTFSGIDISEKIINSYQGIPVVIPSREIRYLDVLPNAANTFIYADQL